MPPPVYPTILTATDWNKKKGIVARVLAVPTKLGDELRKAEEAYKDVNWTEMTAQPHVSATAGDVETMIVKVDQDITHDLGNVSKILREAKTHALQVKSDWSHSKVVPNDSKKHLDLVIAAIDAFVGLLKTDAEAILHRLRVVRDSLAHVNPHQALPVGTGRIAGAGKNNAPVVVGLKPRAPVAPSAAPAPTADD